MTLDELRAHLNALRTDETWRGTWQQRGYDVSDVCACLREMLRQAAKWAGDDGEESQRQLQAWVKFILQYADGKLLDAEYPGPIVRGAGMFVTRHPRRQFPAGEPEYDGDEGRQAWIKFITRCNPQQTFRQATALFQRHNGYWPKWNWPGLPKSATDRLRRIAAVPPERCYPGLPHRDTGPIPD